MGVFPDFPSQEKQMLWPQIFDWADRANNVFLARSYVFSFVARCDPPFWTGNGCAGKGERGGGGRPRANCVWGVYPLTCFY